MTHAPGEERVVTHTDAGSVYRDNHGNILAWGRVLTDREVDMLHKNPYQLLRAPTRGVRWWHRLARALRLAIWP